MASQAVVTAQFMLKINFGSLGTALGLEKDEKDVREDKPELCKEQTSHLEDIPIPGEQFYISRNKNGQATLRAKYVTKKVEEIASLYGDVGHTILTSVLYGY